MTELSPSVCFTYRQGTSCRLPRSSQHGEAGKEPHKSLRWPPRRITAARMAGCLFCACGTQQVKACNKKRLVSLPAFAFTWCRRGESNSHSVARTRP